METEIPESETPEYEICKVDLIYFINNDSQKKGILNFDKSLDYISYEEIKKNFSEFLNEIDNNYFLDAGYNELDINFIRFFDGEGWILLEEDAAILLRGKLNLDNLKLMIKANILIGDKQKVIYHYYNIVNKIKNIQDNLWGNRKNIPPDAPLNLIVLTANPLMDGKIELRTMNDFNIIPAKIHMLLNEYGYLNYTEFFPLTMNTLTDILSNDAKRPVILHLICKSTYIVRENKDNQFTNLIFEQDEDDKNKSKYNLEFIDKEKLEKIFNSDEKIKENIKKITLIISTPLAEDVYELFVNFGFKNLLVQHTTLADVNYIADFNYKFYYELIQKQPISLNELYNSINININMNNENPPSFCCCNHKHKKNCNLIKNLKNELYNDNIENNNKEQKINKSYLKKTIPHFFHLFPSCLKDCYNKIKKSSNPNPNYVFSLHSIWCKKDYYFQEKSNNKEIKIGEKRFFNLCCCPDITEKEVEKHTLNTIFFKNFKEEKIRFRIEYMMPENKYVPNFSEMKLLVGQNKLVLDIIKFIDSDKLYNYYIQGTSIDNLKILGNIIIEYYKEKNYDYNEPDDLEEEHLNLDIIKRMNSDTDLCMNKGYENLSDDNMNLIWNKSSPNILKVSKSKIFENFELLDNETNILDFKNKVLNNNDTNYNKIYFIYSNEINLLKEAKKKTSKKRIKIIWLYKDILEDIDIKENINKAEFKYEPKLTNDMYKKEDKISTNLYIQFQNMKDLKNNWRNNLLKINNTH